MHEVGVNLARATGLLVENGSDYVLIQAQFDEAELSVNGQFFKKLVHVARWTFFKPTSHDNKFLVYPFDKDKLSIAAIKGYSSFERCVFFYLFRHFHFALSGGIDESFEKKTLKKVKSPLSPGTWLRQ